jgi:hypothetical protein
MHHLRLALRDLFLIGPNLKAPTLIQVQLQGDEGAVACLGPSHALEVPVKMGLELLARVVPQKPHALVDALHRPRATWAQEKENDVSAKRTTFTPQGSRTRQGGRGGEAGGWVTCVLFLCQEMFGQVSLNARPLPPAGSVTSSRRTPSGAHALST